MQRPATDGLDRVAQVPFEAAQVTVAKPAFTPVLAPAFRAGFETREAQPGRDGSRPGGRLFLLHARTPSDDNDSDGLGKATPLSGKNWSCVKAALRLVLEYDIHQH